ncbi:UDP-Glycosyltransferase/glycogen phosphorylase [Trametes versicolor FP-101664 SS1]|uniref:UDP-Glycosyltransferase/glycogen phosphorylase n=1 Tax=Trametes versicolor (strain FP-101664) TaxID=717944 RepID=UPI00046218BA|nr:UDP-Glycosyltransferase/glycogen phosphorylase [Trametes versicolor FP-101664 SS1]EIW63128.1 UDP-Glycosyltransferase/glycogen phosphorylase [Trametes versicolor FP-101664 SS1]
MAIDVTPKHIVAVPYQAWGHARPLINLAARLVKLRNIAVTLLTTSQLYSRAISEIARSFVPGEEEFANRIRVVSLGDSHAFSPDGIGAIFKPAWKKISAGEAVLCAETGVLFDALPVPEASIVDLFAIEPVRVIKKLSGKSIKIYSWVPGATSALFHLFGPENLGGRGDIVAKVEAEVKRTGRRFEDVAAELIFTPKGEVVKVPALPPMFDYEYYPQDFPIPRVMDLGLAIYPYVFETMESCDGAFLITAEPYEPEAVAAVKSWFGKTGRPAYVCGPLLPPSSTTSTANEKQQSTVAVEIQEFLDSTLKNSGEKALLYISLGTLFWPVKTPEQMWVILDVVMERNIPFILSHASPMAIIPEEVREKVKAYGRGLLSPWSPQQTILEHPVTGWYLTHGGHNGVTEAVCAGVPFILWPFGGDQPLNAVHISEQLKVGYELIEVRTGVAGRHTIYGKGRAPVGSIEAIKAEVRDVLTKAYGPDGAEKRQRLVALTRDVTHEWEEGGSALRDVRAFLDTL